jgi:hypothetical protein
MYSRELCREFLLCKRKKEKDVQKTKSLGFSSFEINAATTEEQTASSRFPVEEEVKKRCF